MNKRPKALLCEVAAALLLGAGALLFVATYLPVINPLVFPPDDSSLMMRWELRHGESPMTDPWLTHYLVGTPVSLLLLATAWYFNVKGIRLRGEH
jgi:hypothetical protein